MLFAKLAKDYDYFNAVLSVGCHTSWRRRAAAHLSNLLPAPAQVLDLAAGTGDMARALLAHPNLDLTLCDLTPAMLQLARAKLPSLADNKFVVADAANLPFPAASFDALTCAFGFRNFPDPAAALAQAARVLRPGGAMMVLEFFRPHSVLLGKFTEWWLRWGVHLVAWLRRAPHLVADCDYLCATIQRTLNEQEFINLAATHHFTLQHRHFYAPCCTELIFNYNPNQGDTYVK